jgi:hypothetical protein
VRVYTDDSHVQNTAHDLSLINSNHLRIRLQETKKLARLEISLAQA